MATTKELSWTYNFPLNSKEDKQREESLKSFIEENYKDKETGKSRQFTITYTVYTQDYNTEEHLYTYTPIRTYTKEEKVRVFVSSCGNICKFSKGSSHRGYPIDHEISKYPECEKRLITGLSTTVKNTNTENDFIKNCDKVINHLKVDGLWEHVRFETEIMKACGYELSKEMYNKSWETSCSLRSKITDRITQYVSGLAKYNEVLTDEQKFYITDIIPFEEVLKHLNQIDEDYKKIKEIVLKTGNQEIINYFNTLKVNTINEEYCKWEKEDILNAYKKLYGRTFISPYKLFSDFSMVDSLKIKKMTFHTGKWNAPITQHKLEEIAHAIDTKTEYHTSGRNGYDVSFEYNPETNRAWYSEEYKGCGNGHYYLALNRTHAIFYEND